jgi:hypothetical protein
MSSELISSPLKMTDFPIHATVLLSSVAAAAGLADGDGR